MSLSAADSESDSISASVTTSVVSSVVSFLLSSSDESFQAERHASIAAEHTIASILLIFIIISPS